MLRIALMGASLVWFAVYLLYAAAVLLIGYERALAGVLINHTDADRILVWTFVIAITPGLLLLDLTLSRTNRDT